MCIETYISDKIAELCVKNGISKYRLSQKTGISQSALSDITKGKNIPTLATLEKICTAFDITMAQFFSKDCNILDLSEEQLQLLQTWDDLKPEEKKFIRICMESLKKILLTVILFLIILCSETSCMFQVLEDPPEKADSFVPDPECAICGMWSKNQTPYYSQFQSIGIINLNTFDIYDTQIRIFDENGTEILNQEGVQFGYCSFGAEYGYAHINSMPHRGIANIDITYGESDEIDFELLECNLCSVCLEKITVCCMNAGESKCRNIFLMNFQTMDFYALPENLISFMRNDYYFHIDHFDNKDKVLILYVPERKAD